MIQASPMIPPQMDPARTGVLAFWLKEQFFQLKLWIHGTCPCKDASSDEDTGSSTGKVVVAESKLTWEPQWFVKHTEHYG